MKTLVKYRKLGREKAFGLAWGNYVGKKWIPSRVIEIDPRHTGKELMDTVIHELLHTENPSMSEAEVKRQAKEFSTVLWQMNFRRIEK